MQKYFCDYSVAFKVVQFSGARSVLHLEVGMIEV